MTFVKGVSGNPGGRKSEKALKEVKDLAKKHTKAAISKLVEWMESDNAKASVAACNALLDRAHGKPPQAVELAGKDGKAININVNLLPK